MSMEAILSYGDISLDGSAYEIYRLGITYFITLPDRLIVRVGDSPITPVLNRQAQLVSNFPELKGLRSIRGTVYITIQHYGEGDQVECVGISVAPPTAAPAARDWRPAPVDVAPGAYGVFYDDDFEHRGIPFVDGLKLIDNQIAWLDDGDVTKDNRYDFFRPYGEGTLSIYLNKDSQARDIAFRPAGKES